jgi:CRISPR-associated protein Csd1
MIVHALCRYYDILEKDSKVKISTYGLSSAKVSFVLYISREGVLTNIIDLRTDGKRPQPRRMEVPYQKSRSSNIFPYFLCDKAEYVFGVEKVDNGPKRKKMEERSEIIAVLEECERSVIIKSKRSSECFEQFRIIHHKLLDGVSDPAVISLLKFLDSWRPESFLDNPKINEYKDELFGSGTLVFECEGAYLHENGAAMRAWTERGGLNDPSDEKVVAQCLVTGRSEPIARLHQMIKGVTGSQVTGASLVSFNDDAFCSYGKRQSYNAPVGRVSENKYTTVLNHLLTRESRNKIHIDDTTIVFWAETSDRTYVDLVTFFLDPQDIVAEKNGVISDSMVRDKRTLQLISDILEKVRSGQPVSEEAARIDPERTNFYMLGLSPNAARLAVRFWYQDSFGNFLARVAQHHLDMEIIRDDGGPPYISTYRLLKESVPQNSREKASSPLLDGLLMGSILRGTPYPVQLYNAILSRGKVEGSINHVRAGFIKAYLLRMIRHGHLNLKEDLITVSLNEESMNVPYRLGRLFAVLEKAQTDTKKEKKSTIKSKYFSGAAINPAAVFPVLIKLAQHHIADSDYGYITNRSIEEIMSGIDEFPTFLTLEEQGMFMIGYYHQRKEFYKKKGDEMEEET